MRNSNAVHGTRVWMAGLALLVGLAASVPAQSQNDAPPQPAGPEVVQRVAPSVVLILVGDGGGRLSQTGTGLVVRSDGVLLTAYHLIEDAREVQVRLQNGETFDRVELLGTDPRRDIAALRISATGLPVLPVVGLDKVAPGEPVFVVSHPEGLGWSASEGVLSAVRPADEVAGAGEGYRLLQFTAPVSPGSSGGALVDAQGRVLGIVTRGSGGWKTQNLNFAVPVESVLGLAEGAQRLLLGPGSELQPPQPARSPRAVEAVTADPAGIAQRARTLYIASGSLWVEEDAMANALGQRKEVKQWGLVLVSDRRAADLILTVDRPVFTYDFTYQLVDAKTSIILASGKVIAFDGTRAAPMIAKKFVEQFKSLRPLPAVESAEKKPAPAGEEKK